MRFRGPLVNSYWSAVLLVVCALVPFLALSSALVPMIPIIGRDLHLSTQALALTLGLSNAAYALGTVLSVQLAVHYPQRRLLVIYAAIFTVGSVLSATAFTPGLFIAGHVIQGLFTSMMLIAAAPALVLGWPSSRLPTTAMVMNLGIFGAVAAGPFIGGVQANADAWRPLFWIVCGVGALALILSLLTFEDTPAQDPHAPRDWWAIVLAGTGCAAAFFGAAELQTHRMLDLIVFVPLLTGVGLLLALILHQVVARNPLMPMAQLLSTFPVAAVTIAIAAGAGSVALIELVQTTLSGHASPAHVGVLFLPEVGGAVFTAFLFGSLIRTRFVPLLAWTGLLAIAGGAAVLTGVTGDSNALVLVGSGLIGLGLGSSVAPALFSTGFSLRAGQLPRVFAMLELLRGAAAFAVGPIILHLATTVGGSPAAGTEIAIWVCFAIVVTGALVSLYVFILGRARLQVPDIKHWEETGEPAWYSPPLAAGIRQPHPLSANGNGNGLLDPCSAAAAHVEAMARALQLAHGEIPGED
ncbi:MAG: MFS transporter [Solirubrobacteraceae bacterium]